MDPYPPTHPRRWPVRLLVALALVGLGLSGCRPLWEVALDAPDGAPVTVDRATLRALESFAVEADGGTAVPLERVLYHAGHRLVDRVTLRDAAGASHAYNWTAVADDALWHMDGQVTIGGELWTPTRISVTAPALPAGASAAELASLTDLAPTAAEALGLPRPAAAQGQRLTAGGGSGADHVALIFLDAFGYVRYIEARDAGLIPYLGSLDAPRMALASYPPCTAVASAAILTGAPPEVNGVDRRGPRSTEVETLFDVAHGAGLRGVAVEGSALSFNLRNAEVQLSGDRDGDDSTDDNVLEHALEHALAAAAPELLWVHFHGIDDAGHSYGPGAPEERAKIREVDAAVERLVDALPEDTLVLIFADHGMHAVDEGERAGNHGHLIARDMLVPIFIVRK